MRILVFGMSSDKFGGIESFLLNMNKFMSEDCVFDYVLLGKSTVFENKIKEKGGREIYVVSPAGRKTRVKIPITWYI